MRVVLSGVFFAWPATGTGQYTLRLAHELRSLVDDLIIVPTPASLHAPLNPLRKIAIEQWTVPRAAMDVQPDVLHIPYFGPPLWTPVPTIVTIHDVIMLVLPEHRGSLGVRAYTRLAAAAARRATLIIADSEWTKHDIRRLLGIPAERVRVVPLAVDERFQPMLPSSTLAAVRARYALPERFILYIGDFNRRKNLETLLEAFRYVETNHKLVIAGRSVGRRRTALYPDLDTCVRRLGLTDRVHFTGHIDEQDKPALYAACDLFVFPSRYEGFGLTPLEAMAAGAPVISSNAASLPEVVGDAGILVEPTADALAGAIRRVLGDPDLASRLRQAGIARARQFTWRRTAELTVAAYGDALHLASMRRRQPVESRWPLDESEKRKRVP